MEIIDYTKLKAFNYNRKSSEDDSRQVLSNDSQVDEISKLAKQLNIKILATVKESKSGKTADKRPLFAEMIKDIRKNKYDTILCWKLDRLARNMIEGGIIIDMLQRGQIKCIITPSKIYDHTENAILMAVEFGSANQFVRDLSVNVKRGQTKKASMGFPHGVASLGFLNDKSEEKGNRKWKVDKARLSKVNLLLRKYIEGGFTAGKLYDYAINDLGLTTVSRKKSGGGPITRSRIYEILKDPIYAGFFFYGGNRYELHKSLPRLITESEHNKILRLLGQRSLPKVKNHSTLYSGLIKSSEGYVLAQDVKLQTICDCKRKFSCVLSSVCPTCGTDISAMVSPKLLEYRYHYDSRKKKTGKEYNYVGEKNITNSLVEYLSINFVLSPSLVEWSKKHIPELKDSEIEENLMVERNIEEDKKNYEEAKARAREMFRDGHITNDEYKVDLSRINSKYSHIIKHKDTEEINWIDQLNKIADFTVSISEVMKNGSLDQKRNMLFSLGANLVWDEENLCFTWSKGVTALINGIKGIREKFPWFEPKIDLVEQGLNEKTSEFSPVFSTMLRG